MKLKYWPLGLALVAGSPAFAITINVTDFVFGPPADVTFTDTLTGVDYDGAASGFSATMSDSAPMAVTAQAVAQVVQPLASSTSFTAYCVEITQDFYFNTVYQYSLEAGSLYFSAQKTTDLSRLLTATAGFAVNAATTAALQAAIWEIEYEQGTNYDLFSGAVTITPNDADDQAAFAQVDTYLKNLSSYAANYNIQVLTSPTAQDFLVVSVPEPGTWAMMAAGLGVLGLLARRRRGPGRQGVSVTSPK